MAVKNRHSQLGWESHETKLVINSYRIKCGMTKKTVTLNFK